MCPLRIQRRAGRLSSDERGSVLLEATVLVPMLLILVLGVYEFSNYFLQQHIVSTGVRDAARYMARASTSDDAAETTAKNLAVYGFPGGGGSPRVPGWTTGQVDVVPIPIENDGDPPYRGGNPIIVWEVTASFTYTPLGFLSFLGLGSLQMDVSHSQRAISETPG